ncbi:probable disease resistance protein At1g58602 isoform X1 [Salvia hispanica]|uniref:probable disease resistance protein At1g58602 isoform X1 n=1 Tax=Salvia hispanica TaxID=49212 RepID=UPI00200938F3|nr:probable disease resistance protein At1g58602 isoform X1 [Salvia hispanica]
MEEAVVAVALETLRDLLLEEGRLLVGVGGQVQTLQVQLKEIKCLLRDADSKQHQSQTVRNWLSQIRDLSYRAEDVILEYAIRISSDGRRRGLKLFLRRFCLCYSLHQLGSEIADIKSELARVTDDMKSYGISRIIDGEGNSVQNWARKTFPDFEIEDCFVGKQDDLKRLVSLLLDDEHRVVSVWGMGGIGKTTIAKKVYNHMIEAEKDRFDSFAWVCVTQQCQIRSAQEDVLKQLDPEKGDCVSSLSDTQLVEKLCEIQRGKRCLIVLDDIWEICHWDGLKHAFLVRNLKSKILVTTRKQDVAEIGFSVELGLLSSEDSWELLKKKAFPHKKIPEFALQENLITIGKEMVRKCGCLPLAISLLGGVLSKKTCVRDWELVNENIFRGEGHGVKENQINGVLNSSYEDLPYCLKPCFLYLGRLKTDETIYAPDLYRMWIAQGLISDENFKGNDATLTDIAELYLGELVSRSIVQVELEDVIPKQKFKICKLHDVVRELCLSMGKKEDFGVQVLDYQGGKFSTLLQEALSRIKTRHLAVHFKTELQLEHDGITVTCAEDNRKHLRSLEILNDIEKRRIEFPPQSIVDFWKFKLLRGLVILRFKFADRKLPKGITELVLLRYLRLRECELDSLPSSISNLAYLDTLDLYLSRNVRVPNVLSKMSRLKHLLLPLYDMEKIGNYRLKLDDCVDELESLIGYDSSVHEFKHITRMENLRRLSASVGDNESLSALTNAIATKWNKLSYCTVSIKKGCEFTTSEEGLMKLKQAFTCPNIYALRVCVKLGNLLEKCISDIVTSKIVKLSLLECEIEHDPMGILGKLPSLRELYLGPKSFVGEEMTCPASSFPLLKTVSLARLPNWRKWEVERGAMPLVAEVTITRCPRFEKIPEGFSNIQTLQKLVLSEVPRLRKRVLGSGQGGVDFHKVRHVPSIIINKSVHRMSVPLLDRDLNNKANNICR